ncbi:DUF58 domain-containing protein [Thermostilla marina]
MTPFLATLLQLSVVVVPLAAAAWIWRIYPARAGVIAALLPATASFALLAGETWWPVVWACDGVWAAVMLASLFALRATPGPEVEREVVRVASLGKRHDVRLVLLNRSRRRLSVQVRDGVDAVLKPDIDDFNEILPPRSRVILEYVLRPERRGAFTLGPVHLRIQGLAGLWFRQLELPVVSELHVYPDLKQIGEYAILARRDRLNLLGVRRHRRVGQDHEFERLRDYTIDDDYRHIEWKATARRRKLTVKDFQSSQSQQVVFLVDCGRMMTNEDGGLTLLDHAFNAMLMLSYVALNRHDKVGLMCFSDEVHSFVPPRSGMKQLNRLLHASFDRFPRMVESRYDLAFQQLNYRVRKRSLVVLITNVIDEVNAEAVKTHLKHVHGRHLPLGVLLRNRTLFAPVERYVEEGRDLWAAAAAGWMLAWRDQVLVDLQHQGALVLDVFPDDLTTALVNRYLDIKARHLL